MSASLVVVMPVSRMDYHLAIRCLAWMKLIARRKDHYDLILLCSEKLTEEEVIALQETGPSSRVVVPQNVPEQGYFFAPNFMILAALELMEKDFPGRPMLWVEADCVPMRAGWVQEIEAEYSGCGKPFMGDHVMKTQIPHMTGVAVYGPEWRKLAPALATSIEDPKWGWDSQAAHQTFPQSHRSKTIQQIWRPRPFLPTTWGSVIPPQTALFHQCKDGTLLDCLAQGLTLPKVAQLEKSTYGPDRVATDLEVPAIHNVTILYVTHAKDMDFLRYSIDSAKKFGKGFAGITVAVPKHQEKEFEWVYQYGKLILYDEFPGKGMVQHEAMICRADELCPEAQAILHVDADFCFWGPFTPSDYVVAGKPILYRETYEQALAHNTNRGFWRTATINAVGFEPEFETMIRHPVIHLREVYDFTRKLVEQHTGQQFDKYVLSCKNDFPQEFAEFPLLGAIACKYFDGHYEFVDYDRAKDARECGIGSMAHQYIYRVGRDKGGETWSHGGIGMYESWLRNWLDGRPGAYWAK